MIEAARSRAPTLVVAFAILLLLLLSTLAGLLAWQSYRTTITAAQARAENASQVVATNMRWLVVAAFQALRLIDSDLETRPDAFARDPAGLLDTAVEGLPGKVEAWVFDADGKLLYGSTGGTALSDVAGREHYDALKAGKEWDISRMTTAPIDGGKAFLISRRLKRDGRFSGIASIAIPVDLLADFWRSLGLGDFSAVGVVREDGWLVARYPTPDKPINLIEMPLFRTLLPKQPRGYYLSPVSPADGMARTIGYYKLPGLPLVATAGVSQTAVLDDFWRRIAIGLLFALPVAALLVAATVLIYRLLGRDTRSRVEIAEALDENRMLFREIHHRVKNNLQTVASLIQLQPGPSELKQAMVRRIAAMSAVHEQIYRSDQFARLDLRDYVDDLIGKLKDSYPASVEICSRLEPIEVESETATPLGLIINEVVSNAFKHAFPDGRPGRISISLEADGPASARLRIADNGIGISLPDAPAAEGRGGAAASRHGGMGSRLIAGLTRQIGGASSVTIDGGTAFELIFPLARNGDARAKDARTA